MGGYALRLRRRLAAAAGGLTLAVLAGGCATHGFRDYHVPAFVAPGPARYAEGTHPVELRREDSVQFGGGIRIVRADRARPAPAFEFVDHYGVRHTQETLHGDVVWIDLWAVWCGTCRAEFPFVERLQERFRKVGFTVLAVCRDSPGDAFAEAIDKDWIHFAAVDAGSDDGFPFPYRAFPTSILLDRAGRVRGYWQGHRPHDAMEKAVRFLLAESPEPLADRTVSDGDTGGEPATMPNSANVLRAELTVAPDAVPPGGYFEGTVTLDVDPGWFLSADRRDGAVPLRVRFAESPAFRILDCRLPVPIPVETSTGARAGHTGLLKMPVWGLLSSDLPRGRAVELEIVATFQACDRTQCLAPADVVLGHQLWVEGEPVDRR